MERNCRNCDKNFRIFPEDLEFYKHISPTFNGEKFSIPPPSLCPNCRYKDRIMAMPPMEFWQRKCMNDGCQNIFQTTYAPVIPKKIYCQECYLKEIY